MSLFSGRGNMCVLKDDFQWLLDKMLDADGIIFSIPIFEKCAAGIFHTIMDRFGPRMGLSNNIVADKISAANGGRRIDPKYMKTRAVSYMGIGGSDWATQIQNDFYLHALTPMWKVIDNEVFMWSLGILTDDSKVARAHQIGVNLAEAAKDIEHETWKGEDGVCPHCHSRNFYIEGDAVAVCGQCGIRGKLVTEDGKVRFTFDESQIEHAHDTLSGQFIHADDIQNNEKNAGAAARSDEYKAKVQRYAEAITAVKPE